MFKSQLRSGQECSHAFNPLLWILRPRQLVLEYSVISEFQDVDAKYEIQQGNKKKKKTKNENEKITSRAQNRQAGRFSAGP